MLIDSHAHLTDRKLMSDLRNVLDRAGEAELGAIVTVGADPADSRAVARLVEEVPRKQAEGGHDWPFVYGAIGVHPHDAKVMSDDVLAELADLAAGERIVAIGECGLDFYRDLSPRDQQEVAFAQQIQLALELDLPLVVHSRDAHEQTLAILEREGGGKLRGIMHCFSGDMKIAERTLALGMHISIAGPVTYPNARALAEVATQVPLDRLLVETDCPYLTPQRYRGKRNEPAYVMYVAEAIAELRGVSFDEVARATTQNAAELLGISV
ncbi:MAG: TatD family hydrolase [candidate division WS1 bacterium]|nr:TatD family hydrolase [candidate division WS1 bacterium]